ncbi:MAG: hypothetical protein A2149_06640 [Candidatus Schekmanbacteria bacterium RBG_16_38_11]|uniref:histidine kinase n=2 Tax=Candidatus Schekmaniibacteriota TaxID=1817811 RepID=A0A1F7RNX1_9BACT|nr:MAG: hypothetical protein A2042_04990 [Candidatus Schekmanbacteria bacterium GWA2_38_11]OGL46787.1 MAG: hypothetical protein A2149_06640 [Candidatus Schekmanbacteria bacterium RBG_16_38_11]
MEKKLSRISKFSFLSYFGKNSKYIVLALIIISILTLIFMTFNAYKDNKKIVYLKDIILTLLLVSALGFVQYYFLRNMVKPMQNLHQNLEEFVKTDKDLSNKDKENERENREIGKLIENINSTIISFDHAKKELLEDKTELELSFKMISYERKRLQSVLDCLPEALVVTGPSGEILFANNVAETIFKFSKKDVLGKTLKGLINDSNLKGFVEKNELAENRVLVQEMEIGNNGEGIRKSFKVIYDLVKSENEKVLGNALILIDNSHQKMAEQMRNDFVSSVSHELRTPLTSIKSKVEMLLDEEVNDKDTQIEFYNGIIEEVDRLSNLIENLLNISKIELGSASVNKSSVRIKKLLEDSFLMIEPLANKKGVTLHKDIPDRLSASVELDKQMIQMAINNLVGNAIKYTPKGGEIYLEGEEKEKEVIIHVKDTGIGIPEEDQPHVFEKFFRSNQKEVRENPGNGLGLSVVKQIVMLHGGEIKLESKVGQGTHFTLTLPKERGSIV